MKFSQKGFSAVEGLLTLIAITLIGFVGYYVYHTQHATDSTYKAASRVAQTATSVSSTKYLAIKELGIKFKLSDGIKDAYYTKSQEGYYYFSVHSFDDNKDLATCRAINSSGIVALITAKVGESDGTFDGGTWTVDSIKQAGLKNVGNTYYGFERGNGICWDPNKPDAPANEAKVNAAIKSFIAAIPSFTKE